MIFLDTFQVLGTVVTGSTVEPISTLPGANRLDPSVSQISLQYYLSGSTTCFGHNSNGDNYLGSFRNRKTVENINPKPQKYKTTKNSFKPKTACKTVKTT